MREDRLDNIYTVVDAVNKLMKNEKSGIIKRNELVRKINNMNKFQPGTIRSGIDHWFRTLIKEGKLERIDKGIYKIL
nr:MAG TPA: Transcriptional regulator, AbiEi antitoxin [Caudoviricetes sp.]